MPTFHFPKDLTTFSGPSPGYGLASTFGSLAMQQVSQVDQLDPGVGGSSMALGHMSPDQTAIHTIRNATHADLMQNSAYMQLYIEKVQLETQLSSQNSLVQQFQGIMATIKGTKSPLENGHLNDSPILDGVPHKQEPQAAMQPQSAGMPLQKVPSPSLLAHDDYPDAAYWTHQSWQDYSEKHDQQGEKIKKLGFICNKDSEFVGASWIKIMTETAKKLWNHLHHHQLAPATWRLISQDAHDYYSNHMYMLYPEFRLCEDDWKVTIFGTIHFPDWSYGSRASGKLTCLRHAFCCAIPSLDTHDSSVAPSQSKGKRACDDKLTNLKSSEKRCHTNATMSVKPTGAIGSTSRSQAALPDASSSASSAGVPTKPHLQPKPRPLHRPTGAMLNVAETPAVVPTPSTPLTLATSNIPRTLLIPSMLIAVANPEVVQAATVSNFQNKSFETPDLSATEAIAISGLQSSSSSPAEMGVSVAQKPQADAMDTEMETVTNNIPSDNVPTTAGPTSATSPGKLTCKLITNPLYSIDIYVIVTY